MKKTLLVALFILIGIIYSYPLILNFGSSIPYTHAPQPGFETVPLMQGDHLLLYYTYWLLKDYFLTPGQDMFREPYTFAIPGWQRPYEPRGLPSSILFLFFSFLGNIIAYNCIVILSFLLCGICTFLLADRYLKNKPAAFLSGLIFAISPFRLSQLFGGHPTGFILFWVPLIVYLYELLWEKKKWLYGWLAGACIFLVCMEEHHMGYYTALFTVFFWLYKYLFSNKAKPLNILQFALLLIPVATGWLASAAYMLHVKSIVFNVSVAGKGRTFDEIKLYAPVIKQFFQRVNTDSEKYIYMGIIPLILIISGIIKKIFFQTKTKNEKDIFPYTFYLLTFFAGVILCLGPNLKYLPVYKLCYKIIPFFHFPRSPARIYTFSLLGLSLLSGYGIMIFKKNYLRYIFIILLCLDFYIYPRIGLTRLSAGNKTYSYIKGTYPKNPLLEIPIWPGESSWTSIYQYYTTIYRIPIINGYSPFVTKQYVDEIFWEFVSINMGMINPEQYELLKKLNVKYINIHEEAYPQKVNPFPFKIALENLKKSPYIKFILNDGPMYLFEILDKPQNIPLNKYTIPAKTGVFYECENMPHRIGEIVEDEDASNNMSLYTNQTVTEPLHLAFGPWQLFPPGRYKILFRLKGKAVIEVTTDKGNRRIAYEDMPDLSDSYKDYIMHFTLDSLTELEFRIIYSGEKPVWADYIYILCEEENDPVWHFEAEDLFHTGRESDSAVYASSELDPPGDMVFGPYRRYPAGKYKITFRLKAGKESKNNSAVINVAEGHSNKILASRTLSGIPTEYKNISVDLELEKPAILEFKLNFLKEVPVYLDSISIEPVSS